MAKRTKPAVTIRPTGFYVVRGLNNALGGIVDAQPAYWDGEAWHIIGWDLTMDDHSSLTVDRPLEL